MPVRDVMTYDVEVVTPAVTLREAAKRMREAGTGFLPVIEEDRLIGTITDHDMVVRALAADRDPDQTPVREVMSEGVVYCYEDDDEGDAAELMAEKQIRRLPVVDRENRLVGVLSLGDIAQRTQDDAAAADAIEGVSRDTGKPRNV